MQRRKLKFSQQEEDSEERERKDEEQEEEGVPTLSSSLKSSYQGIRSPLRVKEAEAFLSVPKEGLFYPISASNFSDFHEGKINRSHTGVNEQLMSPDRLSSDSEFPSSDFSTSTSETPPASPMMELSAIFADSNQTEESKDPEQEQAKLVTKGWLTKRGGTIKTWKRRWFVLTERSIRYFVDKSEKKLRGVIDLLVVDHARLPGAGEIGGERRPSLTASPTSPSPFKRRKSQGANSMSSLELPKPMLEQAKDNTSGSPRNTSEETPPPSPSPLPQPHFPSSSPKGKRRLNQTIAVAPTPPPSPNPPPSPQVPPPSPGGPKNKNEFLFFIVTAKRVYHIRADNEKARDQWVERINKKISVRKFNEHYCYAQVAKGAKKISDETMDKINPQIMQINLSENSLHTLPSLDRFSALTDILLRNNKFTRIPDSVFALGDRLKKLELNNNHIEELPASISLLTNLRCFQIGRSLHSIKIVEDGSDLKYNILKSLPPVRSSFFLFSFSLLLYSSSFSSFLPPSLPHPSSSPPFYFLLSTPPPHL